MNNTATLLVLAAALLAPLLTYLGVVRRLSGKVRTSVAAPLWDESRSIREDLTKRNEFLTQRVDDCGERINRLEKAADRLDKVNDELRAENTALTRLVHAHEATIRLLQTDNKELRELVVKLEEVVNGRA
jgi:chromosome segregation ATPase